MQYVDEFRDPELITKAAEEIRRNAARGFTAVTLRRVIFFCILSLSSYFAGTATRSLHFLPR